MLTKQTKLLHVLSLALEAQFPVCKERTEFKADVHGSKQEVGNEKKSAVNLKSSRFSEIFEALRRKLCSAKRFLSHASHRRETFLDKYIGPAICLLGSLAQSLTKQLARGQL